MKTPSPLKTACWILFMMFFFVLVSAGTLVMIAPRVWEWQEADAPLSSFQEWILGALSFMNEHPLICFGTLVVVLVAALAGILRSEGIALEQETEEPPPAS